MTVLGLLALHAADSGGMRPVLFVLLLIGIVLIIVGAILAVVTLHNQRKAQVTQIALEQLESENR